MILVVSVSPVFSKMAWFCCLFSRAGFISLAITFLTGKIPACLVFSCLDFTHTVGETIRILVDIFMIETEWT